MKLETKERPHTNTDSQALSYRSIPDDVSDDDSDSSISKALEAKKIEEEKKAKKSPKIKV